MLHTRLMAQHPVAAPADARAIDRLHDSLVAAGPVPRRTEKLCRAPVAKKAQKLVEEATEVAIEAVREDRAAVIAESVDLLYHLVVVWQDAGVRPAEVWAEMEARAMALGVCGKLPKGKASKKRKRLGRARAAQLTLIEASSV